MKIAIPKYTTTQSKDPSKNGPIFRVGVVCLGVYLPAIEFNTAASEFLVKISPDELVKNAMKTKKSEPKNMVLNRLKSKYVDIPKRIPISATNTSNNVIKNLFINPPPCKE